MALGLCLRCDADLGALELRSHARFCSPKCRTRWHYHRDRRLAASFLDVLEALDGADDDTIVELLASARELAVSSA